MLTIATTYSGLTPLLARYELAVILVGEGAAIPGSYWGAPEAGLVANRLYVRNDTPLHSALHEACHYICMDATRRHALHTDAAGDDQEECAVCYLQIVLADALPGVGKAALCCDMDAWGYSFRLGSAQRWFDEDAWDARDWLIQHGIIENDNVPTWRHRDDQRNPSPDSQRGTKQ